MVSQPSTVDALVRSALDAGATEVKPVTKSFWGYGGAVQAPDGTLWTIASSSKKDTGPATREVDEVVLLLGVEDVKATKAFYAEHGLAVGKSFGSKYVEFDTPGSAVKLALYSRKAAAKNAGVDPEGSGSHRIVIAGDAGASPTRTGSCGRLADRVRHRGPHHHGHEANVAADSHDLIRVQGARENNLKDVSVELPKRRLTAFTGVSGSGKSSLVFSTIAAESQRMINETYSAFVQGFMPTLSRPEVDLLEGLTTAIIVDQERMGANPRSTVGTATDAYAMLRILFSRIGKPHIGAAHGVLLQRPDPRRERRDDDREGPGRTERNVVRKAVYLGGMCPTCEGMGAINDFDLTAIYDESKSLAEGALLVPGYSMDGWYGRIFSGAGLDMDKPIGKYTQKELKKLLYGEPEKIKVEGVNLTYEGVLTKVQKSMLSKDVEAMQPHVRRFVERAVTFTTCPDCGGTRLSKEARSSKINGKNIADLCAMQISDLAEWLRGGQGAGRRAAARRAAAPARLVRGDRARLPLARPAGRHAVRGRGAADQDDPPPRLVAHRRHLRLRRADDRPAPARHRADEPAAAPAARQGQHRARRRAQARDDRDRRPLRRPRARRRYGGRRGGLRGHLRRGSGRARPSPDGTSTTGSRSRSRPATPDGALEVRKASTHNLQNVDVDLPLGVLCVLTGVAGSGKSSLIQGSVAGREGVVVIDQGAIKGSRRSNPATYTGLLEPIRKAFAKENGVKPALFSANSEGACPACNGAGVIFTELGVMATVESTCEECEGRRFQAAVLEYTFGGKDITEVLAMPVAEALEFFGEGEASIPAAHKVLARLADVGLGYVSLGQPLTTLSGGERQRLKLAAQMAEKGEVYVLDEPTTGLHLADVEQLLGLLDRLVDSGKSVIVIEHHQAVMAHADWIIDLGPGAGHDGGKVVFEGTPAELVAKKKTLTGKHLAAYVSG